MQSVAPQTDAQTQIHIYSIYVYMYIYILTLDVDQCGILRMKACRRNPLKSFISLPNICVQRGKCCTHHRSCINTMLGEGTHMYINLFVYTFNYIYTHTHTYKYEYELKLILSFSSPLVTFN